jgi:hypothetical protein
VKGDFAQRAIQRRGLVLKPSPDKKCRPAAFMRITMDVRWEKQNVVAGKNGRGGSLVAFLVENNQGAEQTKSCFVEQLGSINEQFLNTKARDMRSFHQGLFWARVDKKLDELVINPEERKLIESKISETVSRPHEDWALWSVTCIPRYDP